MKAWKLIQAGVCLLAGVPAYAGSIQFDGLEADLLPVSSEKSAIRLEEAALPETGRKVPALRWKEPWSGTAGVRFSTAVPHFRQLARVPLTLNLRLPAPLPPDRVVLRMTDRTGRLFRYPGNEAPADSRQGGSAISFTVTDTPGAAGPDGNPVIYWPLRFDGVEFHVSGNSPAAGEILFDSLEFPDEIERPTFRLDTGHPMNLLLPGNRNNPKLVIGNAGNKIAEFTGVMTVSDADGNAETTELSCRIEPGQDVSFTVPGEFSRQEFRLVQCRLKGASGAEFTGTHRFASMNPAGPTPGGAEEFLFGLCGHPERFTRQEAAMEAVAAGLCGAKILRMELSWRMVQPKPGVWDFELYDYLVDHFAGNGVEMQFLFSVDAPWAVDPEYRPKLPGARRVGGNWMPQLPAFSEFVTRAADRYRKHARYFEIWNEPDLVSFANYPAEQYMKLLRTGYDAVKKANPAAKVMNGGIAFTGSNASGNPTHNNGLFEQLLADGGKHFDLFAFHGHGEFPFYVRELGELAEKYKLTAPGKPWGWYSNETAISSAHAGEKKQAEVLCKKLLYAWANGAVGFNWYLLREKSYYPPGSHERHFGLVTVEFEPKPAYLTYNMLAANFRGGKFLKRLPAGDGVYALLFESPSGDGLLALWSETRERLIAVPGLPAGTTRIDLYGNEAPLTAGDGLTLLKLTGTPFTLKLPGSARKEAPLLNTEIPSRALPELLLVGPGNEAMLEFPLHNTTGVPMAGTVAIETPGSISAAQPARSFSLRPGEQIRLPFRLSAASDFRATVEKPAKLQLNVTLSGSGTESLPVEICRQPAEREVTFRLDRDEHYFTLVPSVPGNEHLYRQGPEDLSATITLARRGNALKLRAEVTDDRHVQPHRGREVWQGDNIQLGFLLPGQDRPWKIGLTCLADGKPEVFVWNCPSGFRADPAKIRLSARRDEKRKLTSYEADIPFSAIGMTPGTAGRGFLFNLIVNDNDGDMRKGFLHVAPGLGYQQDDTSRWRTVGLK